MIPSETYQRILLVIDLLRSGRTLRDACLKIGTSRETIRKYLTLEPELAQLFDEALEDCDDTLAEMLIDIDQVHSDAKMAGVISKNIQWLLSRKRPGKYGDKITVVGTGTADQVILLALEAAIQRIPLPPPPTVHQQIGVTSMIDVTPNRELSIEELCGF